MSGKGSAQRPGDLDAYRAEHERIFSPAQHEVRLCERCGCKVVRVLDREPCPFKECPAEAWRRGQGS